ncbi:hypothetical protein [Marinobacterium aestuariivivens]|uniref:DUF484 family protein n=1 Tax=Marinobacterium aestuariivivens TaxID=1698799 RepID=A0ABW2A2D5_9GAMM
MYAIIGDYLDIELSEAAAQIHRNCALSAQQYHLPGTLAPATEMLMLPERTLLAEMPGPRELALYADRFPEPPPLPEPVDATVAPAAPEFADARAYRQTLERLRSGYELHTRPAHILQALLLGLSQGLGIERLTLQVVQPVDKKLKTAQVIGIDALDPLAQCQAELADAPLMRQLCQRPTCVWINDENRAKLVPLLPAEYRTVLTGQDGLLMSVFMKERPVAVIYGDLGHNGPVTAFHRDHFRDLCGAASQGLRRMLTRNA